MPATPAIRARHRASPPGRSRPGRTFLPGVWGSNLPERPAAAQFSQSCRNYTTALMNGRNDQLVAVQHAADFGMDRLVGAQVLGPALFVLHRVLRALVAHHIEANGVPV